MNFIKEAILRALKPIDGKPEIWLTKNKAFSSKLLTKNNKISKNIDLYSGEQPIFEFYNYKNYSLITSIRVISIRDNSFKDMFLKDIVDVRPLIPKGENSEIKPWTLFSVKNKNDIKFLMEFDQYNPTYFALMLVSQLSSKLKYDKWEDE
jgi:hypothetical protein